MRINVRVVARAKKDRIIRTKEGLKVYIVEPAIEGRANKKLIAILAEYYQVKKYNISILKGQSSRDKVIDVNENS